MSASKPTEPLMSTTMSCSAAVPPSPMSEKLTARIPAAEPSSASSMHCCGVLYEYSRRSRRFLDGCSAGKPVQPGCFQLRWKLHATYSRCSEECETSRREQANTFLSRNPWDEIAERRHNALLDNIDADSVHPQSGAGTQHGLDDDPVLRLGRRPVDLVQRVEADQALQGEAPPSV